MTSLAARLFVDAVPERGRRSRLLSALAALLAPRVVDHRRTKDRVDRLLASDIWRYRI